ncbi:PepSY domain-containing protein [Microbulbifer thermotolerans]|uniref:PepSY domain-containing protein n=1 Tax=Microbulbifer thermotolerans TaxID=252514 RepID=A0A143HKC8_MICTH|nr:PepSY domain-containing protein [Microbulbifer thermotolerans]AMX02168.1 hypothetical protein A3224_05845 [Microbulbifer thermotolerans]MCX2793752.1 PepSY domain-containing protein [Microbulbifer thermotolerans]MCX2800935.1 PepSY domain-containing protein [Microbulbifer thermotolerans]MCX2834696.1 PepSY domain-containing protein [Microbulbifer thermotolerans]MCX2841189.1 PepSY domain-containing protein [Microbulbifer thermotolerans]
MKINCAAIRSFPLVIALLMSVPAAQLQAAGAHERGGLRPEFSLVQKKGGVSRDEAAAIVKRRYGGKILAISEVQRDGRKVYRVKGLSKKSQVYVVYVDKRSGRISRS